MNVAPSTAYEATFLYITGQTGVIRLRTIDNDGAVTQAASSANIAERATGFYSAERTSPGTAGQYTLIWDDGTDAGVLATEDLNVTSDVATLDAPTGTLYVTRDEVKNALLLEGTSYSDDEIDLKCYTASRDIDDYAGTVFYDVSETRVYDADPASPVLVIDDLVTLASVEVDTDDDGTYDETWTTHDLRLEPPNNALRGFPYFRLRLLNRAGHTWPRSESAVRVTGTFGWAEVPPPIRTAAMILAIRYLKRGETPYAVVSVGAGENTAAARLARVDPDVAGAIDRLLTAQGRRLSQQSVQLT